MHEGEGVDLYVCVCVVGGGGGLYSWVVGGGRSVCMGRGG